MMAIQDATEIIVDIRSIEIQNAQVSFSGKDDDYIYAVYDMQVDEQLGTALRVYLTDKAESGTLVYLRLTYSTTPESTAINWLNPEQTASKKLSYMFTECQPSYCRSFAPLQDTPAIKTTYTARVTTPAGYTTRMSAVTGDSVTNDDKTVTTSFSQTIKIPSYLLAISVGNLEYRKIGSRTGVISEPDVVDKDLTELKDLDDLLNKTEAYMGTYIWGTYNIIVQPPSFPIGGMENPLLTFASPTIIVGDGS